jgi:hypothetical protein
VQDLWIGLSVVVTFLALYIPSFWLAGRPSRRWLFLALSSLLNLELSALVLGMVVVAAIGGAVGGGPGHNSLPSPWAPAPVAAHFLLLSLAPFLKKVPPAALCVAANVLLFSGLLYLPAQREMAIVFGVSTLLSFPLWVRLVRTPDRAA